MNLRWPQRGAGTDDMCHRFHARRLRGARVRCAGGLSLSSYVRPRLTDDALATTGAVSSRGCRGSAPVIMLSGRGRLARDTGLRNKHAYVA